MLQLENVYTSYGNIKALKGISLNVQKGEIVTVIGANGAGKSTTLKTITGLLAPQSGTITFEDQRIDGLAAEKIATRGVALVPEGRRLFVDMTVYENLIMGAYNVKDPAAREKSLARCYKLFPILEARKNQLALTLSGGEQQMAAIGRSLMTQPRLLLLDEPSLGLAPMLVRSVFKLLQEIRDQGTTILLVEQNSNMALQIADRGYVLQTGVIALEDTAKALLKSDVVRASYLGE